MCVLRDCQYPCVPARGLHLRMWWITSTENTHLTRPYLLYTIIGLSILEPCIRETTFHIRLQTFYRTDGLIREGLLYTAQFNESLSIIFVWIWLEQPAIQYKPQRCYSQMICTRITPDSLMNDPFHWAQVNKKIDTDSCMHVYRPTKVCRTPADCTSHLHINVTHITNNWTCHSSSI